MGEYGVNIANMSLNRGDVGGEALTLLNLDQVPPAALLERLAEDSDITNAIVVTL